MPKSNVEIVQQTYESTIRELKDASKSLIQASVESVMLKDERLEQILGKCKEITKLLNPEIMNIEINVTGDRYSPLIKFEYRRRKDDEK